MSGCQNVKTGARKYYNRRLRPTHECKGRYCRCAPEVQIQGIAIWLDHVPSGRSLCAYEWFPDWDKNSPTHRAEYIKEMGDLAQVKGKAINLAVEKAKERQRKIIMAKIAKAM